MNVRVRLFAVAKQAARSDWIDLELPEGSTVAQLRSRLGAQMPQLSGLLRQMMFAIDAQYADDGTIITPGADVACVPPVSGG